MVPSPFTRTTSESSIAASAAGSVSQGLPTEWRWMMCPPRAATLASIAAMTASHPK